VIFDTFDNHALYPYGPAWERVFSFLKSLDANTEPGRYEIDGDAIFAIVMCYNTTTPEGSLLESHRRYVDVQSVLSGAERFECAPVPALEVEVPYDDAKDVQFYRRDGRRPLGVDVTPGTFVMLYPGDAHMAMLRVGGRSETIKKVVVKVRVDLLG